MRWRLRFEGMKDLIELIDDGAAFDAEYAGGLSNHRSMALLALARLGASETRLNNFAQAYAVRLQPAPPHQPWPAGDAWAPRLGQRDAWPAYRDLFLHWLITENAGDVLRQVLPTLMRGCGGAAFHGLIRTAYAVAATHRRELADALAYWASRWLDLGDGAAIGRGDEPQTVLRRLQVVHSPADLIFQRMQAAALTPHFRATAAQLRVHAGTLPRLAALAAQAYAASGNFTALHLVTSAHAMRVLLPFVDEPLPALRAYWRAYAAAVCVSGLHAGVAPAPRPWPELVAAAVASNDDHLVKLVDSCHAEHAAYAGAGAWQQAATRAVSPR